MGVTAPANAREALDMVGAGLGYLAAADAAQLPAGLRDPPGGQRRQYSADASPPA